MTLCFLPNKDALFNFKKLKEVYPCLRFFIKSQSGFSETGKITENFNVFHI
jgi:hypothetical protein